MCTAKLSMTLNWSFVNYNNYEMTNTLKLHSQDVGPLCPQVGQRTPKFNQIKGIYFVIHGIISGFIDKGQFQCLTNLKGPQEGTYLYTT